MISVIMPVYNTEKYIEESLKSVLNQTYIDFELIAVDDGSTDASRSILKMYAEKDERIKILEQKNSGPSRARNYGMSVARGAWIYFMDSDDVLEPTILEQLINNSCDADVVICGFTKHKVGVVYSYADYTIKSQNINNTKGMKSFLMSIIADESRDLVFNYIWNRIISMDVIQRNRIKFNEEFSLGEDFLFNSQIMENTVRIRIIENALYHYYVRGTSSLIGHFYEDEIERRRLVYSILVGLYKKYDAYIECKGELEKSEGRLSLVGLGKINYPTCKLSQSEKIAYINAFLCDERKDYMIRYLKSNKTFKDVVKSVLIKLSNPNLILLYFRIVSRKHY